MIWIDVYETKYCNIVFGVTMEAAASKASQKVTQFDSSSNYQRLMEI